MNSYFSNRYNNQNYLESSGINKGYLLMLGFTDEEINILQRLMVDGARIAINSMVSMGLNYQSAQRIKYMHSIVIGKVIINNTDDLSKHLRMMRNSSKKIGIYDLPLTKVKKVPRYAAVAGIKKAPFDIFNSSNYKGIDMFYEVVGVYGNRVTVKSKNKPVIKYGQPKGIEGVLEIRKLLEDGTILVSFENKFVRLLNRFLVVASLRRPQEHHGLAEILCLDGTKVYVYAQTLPFNSITVNRSTQRVYDYGMLGSDMRNKICDAAREVYNNVYGVYCSWEDGNSIYNIEADKQEQESDDIYSDIEF